MDSNYDSMHNLFQIKFPAVTVCNQNRVDCEKLEKIKLICERLQNHNKTNDEEDIVEPKYSNEANELLSDLSNSMILGKNGNETNKEGKVLMKEFLNITKNINKQTM